MEMKWRIEIEQNGGEYTGWVDITAENVERTDKYSLIADGVTMTFDEEIRIDSVTPNVKLSTGKQREEKP